jgi:hypothetical protein
MIATLPTLLLSAVATQAAPPATPTFFEHDGQRYRVVDFQRGENRIIRGKRSDGTKFRFVVRGGQVTGVVDDQPVEFPVADAR